MLCVNCRRIEANYIPRSSYSQRQWSEFKSFKGYRWGSRRCDQGNFHPTADEGHPHGDGWPVLDWLGRRRKHYRFHSDQCLGSQPANYGLTKREMEILTTIVAGLSNKQIARKSSLSDNTVKHDLTNMFEKVGVASRPELALFTITNRRVEPVSGRGAAWMCDKDLRRSL